MVPQPSLNNSIQDTELQHRHSNRITKSNSGSMWPSNWLENGWTGNRKTQALVALLKTVKTRWTPVNNLQWQETPPTSYLWLQPDSTNLFKSNYRHKGTEQSKGKVWKRCLGVLVFLQTSVSENWRLGNVNICPTCKRKKRETEEEAEYNDKMWQVRWYNEKNRKEMGEKWGNR